MTKKNPTSFELTKLDIKRISSAYHEIDLWHLNIEQLDRDKKLSSDAVRRMIIATQKLHDYLTVIKTKAELKKHA